MSTDYEALIAGAREALAAMCDPRDLPGNLTERQRDAEVSRRNALEYGVRTITNVLPDVREWTAKREDAVRRFADLADIRKALCDELLLPELQRVRSGPLANRVTALICGIKAIDRGPEHWDSRPGLGPALEAALRAKGYTPNAHGDLWEGFEPLVGGDNVARRLAEIDRRLAEAQSRLDAAAVMVDTALAEPVTR